MALNSNDSYFFRPLWRRVLVTALVAGWFGFETLFSRDPLWITLTGIALAYCAWNFFLRFKDPGEPPPPAPKA